MNGDIVLTLTVKEVDFIATLLQQVPYGQILQAGQVNLLPKIAQQAQAQAAANSEAPSPAA